MFEILNSINRSADFYACQSSKAFFPELQIEGLGELALPLCDAQAEQLIQLCSRAPYGKGTQTLVDESVRKVWELDSSKISSGNQAWQRFIKRILRHYEEVLDLQGQTLIAHPYKLLLYDAGSFFLSHQDSEKEDGMVATLVITLPSAHEGGELTIRHRNQSVSIDFSSQ
ncbi:MAG: 2OG-Fe(II) oxygenase, partial [Thiolinea sp.]